MSTTKSALWHLKQEKLESEDQEILTGIEDWVSKAKFEKKNADDFELCVDNGLSDKWKLLKDMDLIKKVRQGVPKLGLPLIHDLIVSTPSMVDNTNTRS